MLLRAMLLLLSAATTSCTRPVTTALGPPARGLPALSTGERVRAQMMTGATHRGILIQSPNTSTLRVWSESAEPVTLPLDSIARIQVNRRERRATIYGALVGGVVGAGVGGLAQSGNDDCGGYNCAEMSAMVFGVLGGLLGFFTGASIWLDEWQEVAFRTTGRTARAQLERFELGVRLAKHPW